MFRLSRTETDALNRSQFATLKSGRGQHRKYLPYAFTEHGAIMAATTLNSPRAVEMSVYVVRASFGCASSSPPTEHLRGSSMNSKAGSRPTTKRLPAF